MLPFPTNFRVPPKQTPNEAVQRAGREKQDLSSSQKKNKAWLGVYLYGRGLAQLLWSPDFYSQ